MNIRLKPLCDLPLPSYATKGAAGFDLASAISYMLDPGDSVTIPTGFAVELDPGWELQIRGRSGLAFQRQISITHGVGTIDSDYRGEIKVCLTNHGSKPYMINRGDRIAQAVLARADQGNIWLVDHLRPSDRGEGGFGSTGK
jgi:dUTP pyrophosphatase